MPTSPITKYTPDALQLITQRLASLNRRVIRASAKATAPSSTQHSNSKLQQRRAAVLLPLVNDNGVPSILYTKRTASMRNHSAEVSFPGGRVDGKESAQDCALRECMEETGIQPSEVECLGLHHDVQTMGQNNPKSIITPVIGFIKRDLRELQLKPSPAEVDFVFTLRLSKFLDFDDHIFHRERYNYPAYNTTYQYTDDLASRHSSDISKVRAPGQLMLQLWGVSAFITKTFIDEIIIGKHFRDESEESEREFEKRQAEELQQWKSG